MRDRAEDPDPPGGVLDDRKHYVESKCPVSFWFALADLDDRQEGWRW
jgi:predicted enzyme related to lactoylglutathione lyase